MGKSNGNVSEAEKYKLLEVRPRKYNDDEDINDNSEELEKELTSMETTGYCIEKDFTRNIHDIEKGELVPANSFGEIYIPNSEKKGKVTNASIIFFIHSVLS